MTSATGRTSFIAADDLADRHGDHVGVAVHVHPVVGVGDEQVLQGHRQRLGSVLLGPGLGPLRLEQAGGLAGVDAGADGVGAARTQERVGHALVGVEVLVLLGGQPDRAGPHALGAQGERGRDLAAGADAAGAEHGHVGTDGVDDLRGEHHAGDLAGVAARLVALGHDDVDAVPDVRERVLGRAGQRRHLHAGRVGLLDDVHGR